MCFQLEKNNRDSKIKFVSYRELIVTADGVRYYPQYTVCVCVLSFSIILIKTKKKQQQQQN